MTPLLIDFGLPFCFCKRIALLNHQAEFGIVLAEIYDPSLGMPSGEVTPRRVQTAPESVQAVDDFQAVMREIRDLLLPEVVCIFQEEADHGKKTCRLLDS